MSQVQVTIQKSATKTAKPAPATKAAPVKADKVKAAKPAKADKAKTAPIAAVKPTQAVDSLKYRVTDAFRPGSGALLFAYTMAWLQTTGLIDGGSIALSKAQKIAGKTAIDYHLGASNKRKTPNFTVAGESIRLTSGAANFFADRAHDPKTRQAYIDMMTTGKIDGAIIKNAAGLTPA